MNVLTGEPLALDLVNTRAHTPAGDVDVLDTVDSLGLWLDRQAERLTALPSPLPAAGLAAVRRLRAHVEAAVTAVADGQAPPAGAVAALNEAAHAAPTHLFLGDSGVETRRDAAPLERLLAELAEAAITLLGTPGASRIKPCEAPGCRMFFLPAHPRRRWCSPELCGNRVRVARHYERAKGAQA